MLFIPTPFSTKGLGCFGSGVARSSLFIRAIPSKGMDFLVFMVFVAWELVLPFLVLVVIVVAMLIVLRK